MYINRFLGRSMNFQNGLSVGFNWVYGNGFTSKTSAVLVSFHHPKSITWRWVLRWHKPTQWLTLPKVTRWFPTGQSKSLMGSYQLVLPIGGALALDYQPHMWKTPAVKTNRD
jgi:hypothetical protein